MGNKKNFVIWLLCPVILIFFATIGAQSIPIKEGAPFIIIFLVKAPIYIVAIAFWVMLIIPTKKDKKSSRWRKGLIIKESYGWPKGHPIFYKGHAIVIHTCPLQCPLEW